MSEFRIFFFEEVCYELLKCYYFIIVARLVLSFFDNVLLCNIVICNLSFVKLQIVVEMQNICTV